MNRPLSQPDGDPTSLSELAQVRINQETPASHVANAIQILDLTLPYSQSPTQITENLSHLRVRLVAALALLGRP